MPKLGNFVAELQVTKSFNVGQTSGGDAPNVFRLMNIKIIRVTTLLVKFSYHWSKRELCIARKNIELITKFGKAITKEKTVKLAVKYV